MNPEPFKAPVFRRLLSYFTPQLIESRAGKISGQLEVSLENGRLVLNGEKVNYSYGALHKVFQLAFSASGVASRKTETALVLGFGTGSVAAILHDELKKNTRITAVENDPEIIDIGKKYFNISRFPGLRVELAAAADFVSSCRDTFDLIVVDVFVEDRVPASCTGEVFLAHLHKLLHPKGILFFNFILAEETQQQYDDFKKNFEKEFPEGEELKFFIGDADNRVFISKKRRQ
ncbi:MAG: spermidine synthase [Bacteroidetes bacterium]|nr:MAG: spermidine synthase [Bacteroidota bacterium]